MMEDLVPKTGMTKPPVWAYFGFVAEADGKLANKEKPVCKECGPTIAIKGSNISNLLSHLWNSHPTIYSWIKGNAGSTAATKRLQSSGSGGQQNILVGFFPKVTRYAWTARRGRSLRGRQIPTASPTRLCSGPSLTGRKPMPYCSQQEILMHSCN